MSDVLRILLIDDDEDTFIIVRKFLRGAGNLRYALEWVSTFEEGLEKIDDASYAAVLIDYRLDARDGLELLDEAIARGLATPVIMLTGQGGREIDIEAMHRGAADYLAKDRLDSETLERSIRYAVERHRLTDNLHRRARELQCMNESLEQFVWAASHDLQTPLRTIIYRLQHLRMLHDEELEGIDSIDSAAKAAKRMSMLLHDLLHYVRSGSDDFARLPFDSKRLITEITQYFSTNEKDVQPYIDAGTLPTVVANQNMIGQVFQNLIQNAIVHASDGKPPHVRISAERVGSDWIFRIEDNGVGIDPADMELIFQPFRRSGRASDSPGSGIGLALCRRIIERHGGRIWCESQPGHGATFLFTIPDFDNNTQGETTSNVRQTA